MSDSVDIKHELKVWPSYFEEVRKGTKNFEIRNDLDKGFQKGDWVLLREFDPKAFSPQLAYSGRQLMARIGYVTSFEQNKGFVVFSLLEVMPCGPAD